MVSLQWRNVGLGLCFAGAVALGGCSTQRQLRDKNVGVATPNYWEGRMAVKVFSTPVQAFSANFELQGNAMQGQLLLSTPLGTSVAELSWSPGLARLITDKEDKTYPSLGTLAHDVTGANIPVTDLFGWLRGEQPHTDRWEADLTGLGNGRLTAHTVNESPAAELKLILDR